MVGDTGDDTAAGAVGFGGAKKTRGALVLALGEGEKSEGVERAGRAPAVAEIDPYEQALAEMRVSLGETTEDGGVHAHGLGEDDHEPDVARLAVERDALLVERQRAGFAPLRGPQRPLRLQRADERTVRRVEGHAEGITDRFENKPTHRLKRLA